jgi:hypothetical protein
MNGCSLSSPVVGEINAIGIPIIRKPKTTVRVLSMKVYHCKAIYLFDVCYLTMSKILEMIGLALIGGTIYSFIGMTESELRWPVFWTCAGGTMVIIVYRNYIKKRKKNM